MKTQILVIGAEEAGLSGERPGIVELVGSFFIESAGDAPPDAILNMVVILLSWTGVGFWCVSLLYHFEFVGNLKYCQ